MVMPSLSDFLVAGLNGCSTCSGASFQTKKVGDEVTDVIIVDMSSSHPLTALSYFTETSSTYSPQRSREPNV